MGKSKISCRRGYLVSILKEIYRQNYILIEYSSLIIIHVTRYLDIDNFSNFTIKNFRSNDLQEMGQQERKGRVVR